MESFKRGDMLYALMAKYSQGTSHIRDFFMSQPVSKTICDARRDPACKRVHAVAAHTVDHVAVFVKKTLDQTGKIPGIILSITIQGDDDLSAGIGKPGVQRGRLAAVAR